MDLKIEEVASLLHVSETTLLRWVQEFHLPSYQLQGQHLFCRSEVEAWILDQSSKKDELLFSKEETEEGGWQTYSLYRAIHRGGVVFIESTSKAGAIEEVIGSVAKDLSLDSSTMIELLIDRENLMTTALGGEVAIPHTRECLIRGPHDVVIVAIPRQPIEWGALDNKGVRVLFFLLACDDKRHLNLLAKIAHLTANKTLIEKIKMG
ncbi:MAG: PTS sugar transporter subunit IIA, partial [Chlamydiia bacterium]